MRRGRYKLRLTCSDMFQDRGYCIYASRALFHYCVNDDRDWVNADTHQSVNELFDVMVGLCECILFVGVVSMSSYVND